KPISDLPPSLRAHIRYPEGLFSVQTQVFALYHMTDPDEFYNRADAWRIAAEVLSSGGNKVPIEPYYVATRLPGSDRREFLLFVPAPQGRIPELQRVVLATQDRVVMAESFEKALDQLFGSVAQPTPTPTPTPSPSPRPSPQPSPGPSASPAPTGSVADLVRSASQHYEQAQDALRRGDFAEYGRLIKLLEDDLARLRAATGQ